MNYWQVIIQDISEERQEELIGKLAELNAEGFEQSGSELKAYFSENLFNKADIKSSVEGYSFSIEEIPEQNWNHLWETNFEPVVVKDFCAIRADFHQPIKGVQHEILITPKMSFGTGHHATTYMMIEQMQNIEFVSKKVLDFGTGTGILAILAEKLGASSVTAIDNDEWSIKNAEENIVTNNCNKINLQLASTVPPHKHYDVILANINKNVISENIKALEAMLHPAAYLLISGLLQTDEEDILATALSTGSLAISNIERKNGWVSILFVKNTASG
jgi:ribosomal protein L11 methyltransferase